MNRWWFAALLAVAGFWMNTRHADFPYYYHPDEPKKVEQILSGERNFNHPLLMLHTVETVWKWQGRPADRQTVVQIGRTISAIFCVVGTLAFMLAAWSWRGPVAGLATGIWLTVHQQVFELAHYFKEDPALYAGTGLFVWAAVVYSQGPGRRNLILLAASVGIAASAKYLGMGLLIPALFLVWKQSSPPASRLQLLGLFLSVSVGCFVLINFRIFSELSVFHASLGKEMNWVVTGEKDVTRSVPHSIYLNVFVEKTSLPVWGLLVIFAVSIFKMKSRRSVLTICLCGAFVGWALLLSFSPKTNDRYFLPLTGFLFLFASCGLAIFAEWIQTRGKWQWSPWLLGACVLAWETQKTVGYFRAFSIDDRADLVRWIATNIPETDTIGYDSKANLPDIETYHELTHPLPHRLLRSFYSADIDVLKDDVHWFVITESTYGRFFLDSLKVKPGQSKDFDRRKIFYAELKKQKPLWARPRSEVLYLHPGLEVFRWENQGAKTENR